MKYSIVWLVEFVGESGQTDTEEFHSEERAREWAKGPWAPGFRATAMWCEIRTTTAGPREVLQ